MRVASRSLACSVHQRRLGLSLAPPLRWRSSAAAAPKLASTLWRALLASARRYDKEPALRSLLATARTAEHDITSGAWGEAERPALGDLQSAEEVAQRVAEHVVRRLCDGGRLYVPGKSDGADRLAVAAVRDAARSALDVAPSHLLVDAGFALLRMLEAPVRISERVLAPRPGVSRPAPPSALSVRPAPSQEETFSAGAVLVSHPLMRRDIVLLLQADGPAGYAFGVVTNQPTGEPIALSQVASPDRTLTWSLTLQARRSEEGLLPAPILQSGRRLLCVGRAPRQLVGIASRSRVEHQAGGAVDDGRAAAEGRDAPAPPRARGRARALSRAGLKGATFSQLCQ